MNQIRILQIKLTLRYLWNPYFQTSHSVGLLACVYNASPLVLNPTEPAGQTQTPPPAPAPPGKLTPGP